MTDETTVCSRCGQPTRLGPFLPPVCDACVEAGRHQVITAEQVKVGDTIMDPVRRSWGAIQVEERWCDPVEYPGVVEFHGIDPSDGHKRGFCMDLDAEVELVPTERANDGSQPGDRGDNPQETATDRAIQAGPALLSPHLRSYPLIGRPKCDRPTNGYYCKLDPGHDGPCPAWPRFWRHPIWWLRCHPVGGRP